MDRVAGDHMGMLATVMNGIALRDALERANVKTRVMSADITLVLTFALSRASLKAIPFITVANIPI